jgi:hypothetical protein
MFRCQWAAKITLLPPTAGTQDGVVVSMNFSLPNTSHPAPGWFEFSSMIPKLLLAQMGLPSRMALRIGQGEITRAATIPSTATN